MTKLKFDSNDDLKVYGIIFFITLGLFGIYGMSTNLVKIGEKREKIDQLNQTKTVIETNLEKAKIVQRQTIDFPEQLEALNSSIPDNVDIENYLNDVIDAISPNGYLIEKFDTKEAGSSEHATEIVISATGSSIFELADAIESLEDLQRISEVKEVELISEQNLVTIKFYVEIFNVEEDLSTL